MDALSTYGSVNRQLSIQYIYVKIGSGCFVKARAVRESPSLGTQLSTGAVKSICPFVYVSYAAIRETSLR